LVAVPVTVVPTSGQLALFFGACPTVAFSFGRALWHACLPRPPSPRSISQLSAVRCSYLFF